MLTINEIFYSIQGESTFAGRPCVFVRLSACDLRCSWCDTEYAFHQGHKQSLDDVLAEVARLNCPLVEVTGGEPLLQDEVYPLMQSLLDRGRTVLLETGGHRSTADVPSPVVTILDVKCPGSGEAHRTEWALNRIRVMRTRAEGGGPRLKRRRRLQRDGAKCNQNAHAISIFAKQCMRTQPRACIVKGYLMLRLIHSETALRAA